MMKSRYWFVFVSVMVAVLIILSACQPRTIVETVEVEKVVEKEVEVEKTVIVEKEIVIEGGADSTDDITIEEDIDTSLTRELRVAFLLAGQINDGSFAQHSYQGVIEAKELLGIEATFLESVQVPDTAKVARDFAADGWDVIYGCGGGLVNGILQVAPDFPDQTFVILSTKIEAPENVWIAGDEQESGYFLPGIIAGHMTKTNKIGFIGGLEIPAYRAASKNFEAGAKYVNPDIEFFEVFTGNFNDPTPAKQAAVGMIEAGADIILGALNMGQFGVIEAARAAESDVRLIGIVLDQKRILGVNQFLTSVTTNHPEMMRRILRKVAEGEKGGYLPMSLESGIIGLSPTYGDVPDEVLAEVEKVKQGLINGEIDYIKISDLQ